MNLLHYLQTAELIKSSAYQNLNNDEKDSSLIPSILYHKYLMEVDDSSLMSELDVRYILYLSVIFYENNKELLQDMRDIDFCSGFIDLYNKYKDDNWKP